jgi:mannose-6-phosphate isomerase-like protein (cupin superfamily)
MSQAFSLDSTYILLRPDESAHAMKGGAAFWTGIESLQDLDHGRLMGSTSQTTDWDYWERHLAGDEILTLLSGELELVLDTPRGEERTLLKAGQTFIVPKGTWHRGIVKKPGQLMFLTPCTNAEHRPV